jgi:hypothetical protein
VNLLGFVLFSNGLADLLCAAVLLALPPLNRPLLGYGAFDPQGAFMAGGWGIAAPALGVIRIRTSARDPRMKHREGDLAGKAVGNDWSV